MRGRLEAAIRIAAVVLAAAQAIGAPTLGQEPGAYDRPASCSTVRGFFGLADTDNRIFRDLSIPGQQERRAFHVTAGSVLGASYEHRFACKIGLEAGLLFADLPALFIFDSGPDPAFWGKAGENVDFPVYTVGLNVHLLSGRRTDLYLGPFVALPDFDDADFELMNMLPEAPGASRTFVQNLDGDVGWGLQLGLDVALGESSPWAVTVAARAMDLSADAGPDLPVALDLDPTLLTVGLAYSSRDRGGAGVLSEYLRNRACGNGRLDEKRGEECDDGNKANGDGCSAACALEPFCGDGTLDAGEECDDGNSTQGDGCSAECTVERRCGDGVRDPGEACDDGNTMGGDGCSAECAVEPFCGDGTRDAGEACDDGNAEDGDGCSAECIVEPFCGDGTRDAGEACDDGNAADGDGCSSRCLVEECGNGRVDAGEACDDGNLDSYDGCSRECRDEPCGDGRIDRERGEQCDDGNRRSYDGCSRTCRIEYCGNGRVDSDRGEECDDGNRRSGDGCSGSCKSEAPGNGRIDKGEECDDGNLENGDGCSEDGKIEDCGNGRIEGAEECDDGNREPGDGCGAGCREAPVGCGNGELEPDRGEECDDGNNRPGDGCSRTCRETPPGCGNGVLEASLGEECDDGDNLPGDGCSRDCRQTPPGCGNGELEPSRGEECDDGGNRPGDGCSAECKQAPPGCGNGRLEAELGEQCDDGGNRSKDGCSFDCSTERPDGSYCGDGVVDGQHGEACDDGNRLGDDGCSVACSEEAGPPGGCAPRLWPLLVFFPAVLFFWWLFRLKSLDPRYLWLWIAPLLALIALVLGFCGLWLPWWLCWLLLLLLLLLLALALWRLLAVPPALAGLPESCAAGIPALNRYRRRLEPIDQANPDEVCDLFLAYRDSRAWEEMFALYEAMSAAVRARPVVRQQLGFALNRDGQDARAVELLEALIAEKGPSPESCGILGRVYKDRWEKAWRAGETGGAKKWLELAIDTYLQGHRADPKDPYPGINVLTLCEFSPTRRRELRGAVLKEVAAACSSRSDSTEYWDVATRLELACHTGDEVEATATLPRVREAARPRKIGCPRFWKLETTRRNLRLLIEGRKLREVETPYWVDVVVSQLDSVSAPESS